ncbi:MAG: CHAT domain-containing protein [Elusimicrobia bacterium]|nr:CHAT domain-containing protein [Elusimicrobiota bacterium]
MRQRQSPPSRARTIFSGALLVLLALPAFAADPRLSTIREAGLQKERRGDVAGASAEYTKGIELAESQKDRRSVAVFHQQLGKLYSNTGAYSRALESLQRAAALSRGIGDRTLEASISLDVGTAYFNMGDFPKAVEQFDVALQLNRDAGDRWGEAYALNNKGNIMMQRDLPRALEYYTQALKIFQEVGDRASQGSTVANIGLIYLARGEFRKALVSLKEGLTISRQHGDLNSATNDLFNIGLCYSNLDDYPNALKYYDEAFEGYRTLGHKSGQGNVHINRCVLYGMRQDYDAALAHCQAGLRVKTEIGDRNGVARAQVFIANLHKNRGEYPKALAAAGAAAAGLHGIGNKNGEAMALTLLGNLHRELGEHAKALDVLERALEIHRRVGGAESIETMSAIGSEYHALGDESSALVYYEQALKSYQGIATKSGEASVLSQIGQIQASQGDPDGALASFEEARRITEGLGNPTKGLDAHIADVYLSQKRLPEALDIFTRLNDPSRLGQYHLAKGMNADAKIDFQRGFDRAKDSGRAQEVFAYYTGLGLAHEGIGDARESRRAFEGAISTLEHERDMLPFSARTHFLSGNYVFPRIEAYEGRVRVAAGADDAFYWSENTKARTFIEGLAGRIGSDAKIPEELAKAESASANRLAALYTQTDAAFRGGDAARRERLNGEIEREKAGRARLIARLRHEYPEYASFRYPEPLKAEQVRLEPDEVLLEYEVTRTETLLFVLAPGKPLKIFKIPIARDDLKALVAAFRRPFEAPRLVDGKLVHGYDDRAAARLRNLLLSPAFEAKAADGEALVPRTAKVVVVPDQILGLLPFGALSAKPAQAGSAARRFVADDYDITYAQSATALTLGRVLSRGNSASSGVFVLADPIFSRADPRRAAARLVSDAPAGREARRRGALEGLMGVKGTREEGVFARLPETGAMAADIQRLFGDDIVILEGSDAVERRVKNEDLSRYRTLIFATHGILDSDVPYVREPALVLGQLGNGQEEDGFLGASEVMNLSLNAETVALTACKTGLGRQLSGEGVMGLGRAFQYAGAKNVLVSLWSVAEKSTTRYTAEYFSALKDGRTQREAAKAARTKIRDDGYDDPFYWAPFIVMGH